MRTLRLLLLTGTMLPGLVLSAPAFARGDGASGTILLAQGGPDERGPRGEGPGGRGGPGGPGGREGPPGGRERPEPRPERGPPQERPQPQERQQPQERSQPRPERAPPQERAPPPAPSERPEPREERAPAPRQQEKPQPAERPAPPAQREAPPAARERAPERAAPPAPPARREVPPDTVTKPPMGKPPAPEAPAGRTPPERPGAQQGKPGPTPPGAADQPMTKERFAPNAGPASPDTRPGGRQDPAGRQEKNAPQDRATPPGASPNTPPGQPGAVPPNERPGVPGRPVQRPDAGERPGADGPGRPVPPDTVTPPGAGRPGEPGGPPNARPGVPGRPFQPPGTGQPGMGEPGRPDLRPGTDPRGNDPRGLPAGRVDGRDGRGFNRPGTPGYVPGGFDAADEGVRDYDRVRRDRREFNEDGRTYIREPGRIIVRDRDTYFIRHDENERFRDLGGGGGYRSERRGPDTYTYLDRPGGEQIVTVVDDDGRMLRRYRRFRDGREVVLIDNGYGGRPRPIYDDVVDLPPPDIRIPRDRYVVDYGGADERAVYEALSAPPVVAVDRRYTLDQVRYSPQLRARMRSVDIDTITFDTASFTVTPDQASRLSTIAAAINQAIRANPQEVFLIEGYTDAVGSDVDNLSLSDRRAQSVATVLTQNFQVPPENLTTQGYGEQYLKVNTQSASRENRRVTVRRITPLLQQSGAAPR